MEFAGAVILRGPKGVGGMKPLLGFLQAESVLTLVDSPPGAESLGGPKWQSVVVVMFGKLNAG